MQLENIFNHFPLISSGNTNLINNMLENMNLENEDDQKKKLKDIDQQEEVVSEARENTRKF